MAVLPGPEAYDAQASAGAWSAAEEPVTVLYGRRVKPGVRPTSRPPHSSSLDTRVRHCWTLRQPRVSHPGTFADRRAFGPGSTLTTGGAGWPGWAPGEAVRRTRPLVGGSCNGFGGIRTGGYRAPRGRRCRVGRVAAGSVRWGGDAAQLGQGRLEAFPPRPAGGQVQAGRRAETVSCPGLLRP